MIRTRRMTIVSTTLAVLLVAPGAIPAVGSDPPPSGEPVSGPAGSPGPVRVRVEVPGQGFALTLPDGWTWDIRQGVPDDLLNGGLFAAAPAGDARCQVTDLDGAGLSEVSLDHWKVVARGDLGDPPTERAALLECQRPAPLGPPDDHRLSVADTFEFLASASPSSSGSRSPSPSAVGSDLAGPTPAASPCDPATRDPSASGYVECWMRTRAHAVALVLATDPRFTDLPDYEFLARKASSEFSLLPLLDSHYRVLSTDAELAQYGFSTPSSWLIEVTLAKDCVEPTSDPAPDPCGWRHSWYHRVLPDGTVTLLYDEGDPDDG